MPAIDRSLSETSPEIRLWRGLCVVVLTVQRARVGAPADETDVATGAVDKCVLRTLPTAHLNRRRAAAVTGLTTQKQPLIDLPAQSSCGGCLGLLT